MSIPPQLLLSSSLMGGVDGDEEGKGQGCRVPHFLRCFILASHRWPQKKPHRAAIAMFNLKKTSRHFTEGLIPDQ